MDWGRPSLGQLEAIRPFVAGKVVHDLGAGNALSLAHELLELGANYVFAIDKDPMTVPQSARIRAERLRFDEYELRKQKIDVAFISWPQNLLSYPLLRLCTGATTVIYLGKNTDGRSCGHPMLFKDFLFRELLAYVPHHLNTLGVYGQYMPSSRRPTGEEFAGIYQDQIYSFADMEHRQSGELLVCPSPAEDKQCAG